MKTVLITGASSGFGHGAAIELAKGGWRVFAAMRNVARAGTLFAETSGADLAGEIIPVELDVTDAGLIASGVAQVLDQAGGQLDVLVNNAGYSMLGAFEDLSDAECRAQMDTNFFGALAVTRAVLPAMRALGHGRLVVITSNAVNAPHPLLSMYAASKWALEGWAEGLAMEVAPFGVEVTVLQPGAHRTPFAQNVQFVQPESSAYRDWLAEAMPGIGKLDQWGRDPSLAVEAIVEAVIAPEVPFRRAIGEDTRLFAMLKGLAPYETRAWLLRQIAGLPAPKAKDKAQDHAVLNQVLQTVLAAAAKDPASASVLAKALFPDALRH
jgi:NAD(P)-dependent dehydrogenase (short-subunit alcohol dehydrogenase family)